MNFKPVEDVLRPQGLGAPILKALVADERNYTVLLFQPKGEIEAGPNGVKHRNRDSARAQFKLFLSESRRLGADLSLTPEYSMPWEVLVESLRSGVVPESGKLWALGCESIRLSELKAHKAALAGEVDILFEDLDDDESRFLDPLAYVFHSPSLDTGQGAKLVVLVQFKTYPMSDREHFEVNALQRGTTLYVFGKARETLRLASLICSDALDFQDQDASALYDRSLVLHLQLNKDPRNYQFRGYRDRLLKYHGNETELLCLNWATDVHLWEGGAESSWGNIAGSAWYLRPDKFDKSDGVLAANHRRGLYYTWLRPLHYHSLFFNFAPATYFLTASKVAHIGVPAVMSRRRGPQLERRSSWKNDPDRWEEQPAADDGFSNLAPQAGGAQNELLRVAAECPIGAERVMAIGVGAIGASENWHDICNLDSCGIESTEIIRRVTFCQDPHQEAVTFRDSRMMRCRNLWDILVDPGKLPPALADLAGGVKLEWSADAPHQNAVGSNGRATVVYVGEEASDARIDAVVTRLSDFLQRQVRGFEAKRKAVQRLAVWYRRNGEVRVSEIEGYVRYDRAGDESGFDIVKE